MVEVVRVQVLDGGKLVVQEVVEHGYQLDADGAGNTPPVSPAQGNNGGGWNPGHLIQGGGGGGATAGVMEHQQQVAGGAGATT